MYYSPFNQFQNYSIRQESITRVTGEEGAKAYQMAPNSSAALFDGNEDIFYLKTTDGAGFPTIRKFKFEEIQAKAPEPAEESDYITREEFEQFREEMRTYGEQYIQKSAETEQRRTESRNHRTSKAGNERRATDGESAEHEFWMQSPRIKLKHCRHRLTSYSFRRLCVG